jgi:hypothetical protein
VREWCEAFSPTLLTFHHSMLFLAVCCAADVARADVVVLPVSKDASIVKGNPNNSNGSGPHRRG